MPFALLQPVLIPDLHDIAVMKAVDTVIIQDSEVWSRKGRTHRAIIRTPEGTDYLNVPVRSEDKKKEIRQVRINQDVDWINPILRALQFNYSNSVYYDFYEPEIESLFESGSDFTYLTEFSNHLKEQLFTFTELNEEIEAKITRSSELKSYDPDPDQLSKTLGDSVYYQEHDARHYQRQGRHKSDLNFRHPEYRQHFEGFEPNCCILDLLFQYGPESFRIVDKL
jgi:hypothetical protein